MLQTSDPLRSPRKGSQVNDASLRQQRKSTSSPRPRIAKLKSEWLEATSPPMPTRQAKRAAREMSLTGYSRVHYCTSGLLAGSKIGYLRLICRPFLSLVCWHHHAPERVANAAAQQRLISSKPAWERTVESAHS